MIFWEFREQKIGRLVIDLKSYNKRSPQPKAVGSQMIKIGLGNVRANIEIEMIYQSFFQEKI